MGVVISIEVILTTVKFDEITQEPRKRYRETVSGSKEHNSEGPQQTEEELRRNFLS